MLLEEKKRQKSIEKGLIRKALNQQKRKEN